MKTTLKRMMTAVLAALFLYPAESRGKEGVVQCGNLIYAGTQTSRFSDDFVHRPAENQHFHQQAVPGRTAGQ
ncbi:hypothetical protein [Akkermansia sp.]|uniref:hypothetical protein n=1 Tax=Akkermansia sp. TaxID=1872421 RepID=UPI003991B49D